MAQNNALNNKSSTFTVDNLLTVSAGGATVSGNSTINAGTVGLGTDAADNDIDIGTAAGAGRDVVIGSQTGASTLTLQGGNTTGVVIDTSTSNGPVSIVTGTGAVFLGGDAASKMIQVGNATGTTELDLVAGTGGVIVTSQDEITLDGIGVVEINSSGAAISIGNDAVAQAVNIGTGAAARATTVGSTTGGSVTTIQAPSAGVVLTGVQGVAVANKNYVTINTATGAIGSDAGPSTSISITGDTGGALTGSSFTFTGGTTGLSFGGSGSTETLTFAGITANGGTVSLATDATTSTIDVGTGAGVKTTTLGSVNSTSATTVQSGSGALNITSTNGAITMNSGTGTVGIGTDATAATYNFATGAGAKLVTLGTTNGASSLALKTGTADFSLASATGTIMSALDTGEITYPLQPAFFAYNSASDTNQTGAGTNVQIPFDSERFDQNGDFASNLFTAPVTGKYLLIANVRTSAITALMTLSEMTIATSNINYAFERKSPGIIKDSANQVTFLGSALVDMDATDTAQVLLVISNGAGDTATINGSNTTMVTMFSGYLVA